MGKAHKDAEAGTHFGEQTVPLADKQGLVDDVFHSVARRYDLMNDLMSGGLHRAWKDALVTAVQSAQERLRVRAARSRRRHRRRRLPRGGGRRRRHPRHRLRHQCRHARRRPRTRARARARPGGRPSSKAMPRNCPIPTAASIASPSPSASATCRASSARSPRPIACSRSAAVSCAWSFPPSTCRDSSSLYELYSFQVIPRIGEAVTGDREAYQYLVESIRKFPKPPVFAKMIEAAGFRRVSFTTMTGGVVALHSGWKL